MARGVGSNSDFNQERGDAKPCFSKFLLENQREYGVADAEIAYVAGSMFGAGSDTVSINLTNSTV